MAWLSVAASGEARADIRIGPDRALTAAAAAAEGAAEVVCADLLVGLADVRGPGRSEPGADRHRADRRRGTA